MAAAFFALCVCVCVCVTERPQEKYDHRTLYDRLKQQKDKKQEEWEDQFKFSESSAVDSIPYYLPCKVT